MTDEELDPARVVEHLKEKEKQESKGKKGRPGGPAEPKKKVP